jgi:hypothetical protein
MSTKCKNCMDCGAEFEAFNCELNGWVFFTAERCETCVQAEEKRRDEQATEEKRMRMHASWLDLCPVEFRNTEYNRLPVPEAYDAVMQWRYGPVGLMLCGDTGLGKSRAQWDLAKREHFAGRSIGHLDKTTLERWGTKKFADPPRAVALAERLERCDLLLLEDIFKAKLRNGSGEGMASEELLWDLIDRRSARRLPNIISTNDTQKSLPTRLSSDRATPIIRRLKEFHQPIPFT